MSLKRQGFPQAKKLFALFAAALVLLSLCGCSAETAVNRFSAAAVNTVAAKAPERSLHFSDPLNPESELITSSGLLELYYDKESFSFFVHDVSCSAFWRSLPVFTADPYAPAAASVVSLTVFRGTDLYVLNSQDNSVAFGRAKYEKTENGLKLIYDIFPDEETAARQKLGENDLGLRAAVDITLVDGALNVSCAVQKLCPNPDVTVTELRLLDHFGAFGESGKDDFILVPDGCGAIIKTHVFDDSFEPLAFPVYGADPAALGEELSGSAVIPAFGMKHEDSAFVALITEGDASAVIYADKATSSSEFNTVGAGFTLTPYHYDGKKLFIASGSGTNRVSVCYRFLSGGNATCAGLASACREQLIRNAVLSNRGVSQDNRLPLNLSVVGAARNNIIGSFGYNVKGTDFEQATDMLSRMKNKGINSVNLRLIGALNGGSSQKDAKQTIKTVHRLGSADDLAALYDFAEAQNMKVFLNLDILSARSLPPSSRASAINGKPLSTLRENRFYPLIGRQTIKAAVRSPADLEGLALSVLTSSQGLSFSGFCIDDCSGILCSDYSNGVFTTRDSAADSIISAVTPLTVERSTMTAGGNFYLLKNADAAVEIPDKTSVAQSGAYRAVPFIQLILHGSLDYSGSPLNLSSNPEEDMLRLIEYGECPYYEWSYGSLSADEESVFSWNEGINTAAEFYTRANAVLGDLRNARMTDHTEIADGVFMTAYDTGARICVNHTNRDFTYSGVVIPAKGFERVN